MNPSETNERMQERARSAMSLRLLKYVGGLVCTFGGIYLGNAYGASYWRFGPLNLAWDTIFRGGVLVIIGMLLIRFSK